MNNSRFKRGIELIYNFFTQKDLYYIVESAPWSILDDGLNITSNLKKLKCRVTTSPYGIRNSIVHYGSINTFFNKDSIRLPHSSNRIVVTWFHISPDDERIRLIPEAIKHVDIWHTSSRLTKEKLVRLGIPSDRIVVIPLGVNINIFSPIPKKTRASKKKKIGIPENSIVIGSFQKDGNGWDKGLEPKMIKGPDIFVEVVKKLAKKHNVHCLLTGPARGYVKNELKKNNIPYSHYYLESHEKLADMYHCLDLYIVSSREEGGPKSILESMASGVPLVTTKVGMAPDLVINGENGYLTEVDNVDALVMGAENILNSMNLRNKFSEQGCKLSQQYNWGKIALQYEQLLYNTD